MIDLRLLRVLLVAGALAGLGCNSSSPLVWSAADDLDEDNDEKVTEEPEQPPPRPPLKDAGMQSEGMDSGVIVAEPMKRPPCGTGPGCDPTDLGGETCESLGAGGGRLLCDSTTCLFELGLCDGLPRDASVGRPCGTGPGCNPDDLGGETCSSLGMQSGTLGCDEETCMFDTSLCGPGGLFGGGNGAGGTGAGTFGGGSGGGTFFGGGNNQDGGTSFFGGNFFGGDDDGEPDAGSD